MAETRAGHGYRNGKFEWTAREGNGDAGLHLSSGRRKESQLDSDYSQAGESGLIEVSINRQQAIATMMGMSADQEIRQDAARTGVTLLPAPGCVGLECPASEPPDLVIQIKLDGQASAAAKLIKEGFGPSGRGHQFGEYRPAQD